MGGDSAGIGGHSNELLELRADTKVFRNSPYLIGVVGSWRVNQLLKYKMLPLSGIVHQRNLHEFMCSVWLPAVRRLLATDGCQDNFELLVGIHGKLFHVYDREQVAEIRENYDAAGSGAQIARGAMYAMDNTDRPPEVKILTALDAAERFCAHVRGPLHFVEE
jgi:hypothetical protein